MLYEFSGVVNLQLRLPRRTGMSIKVVIKQSKLIIPASSSSEQTHVPPSVSMDVVPPMDWTPEPYVVILGAVNRQVGHVWGSRVPFTVETCENAPETPKKNQHVVTDPPRVSGVSSEGI